VSGQSDGFIDVNTELSDDSDHEEVGGPDQEECRGGGGSNYNSSTNHMTVNSSRIIYNNEPGATVITPMPVSRSVFLNSSVRDCVCCVCSMSVCVSVLCVREKEIMTMIVPTGSGSTRLRFWYQ